jgi:tetratricopeptide (TPR) repeat protein
VKDSDLIIGRDNVIDKSIRTTNNFKTIIQNASPIQFFVFGLLAILAASLLGWLVYYNFFRYNRTIASGQLNVLVIPFVEERPWGYANSDLGWSIAQILADGTKKAFGETGIGMDIKILGPSEKVPQIFPFTENQLNRAAEKISEEINGQIVIYGVISKDEYGDSIVTTKVYISPTNFGEAQELISDSMMGELSLGSFRLTGDTVSGADLLAQNKELRDRLEIFSSIINFLGAYVGEDFDRAQLYIENASDTSLWSNTKGLEVVYLIRGNMQIRHARVMMVNKDLEAALAAIELATGYFEESANISIKNGYGRYARAYLGLAGAESLYAIVEANIMGDVSLINIAALDRSLIYLDEAEHAEHQPGTADVSVKVNYSKAQTALAYFAITGDVEHLEDSRRYYERVIDEYERTKNRRVVEFAALSHSGLGHIAANNGQVETAVSHFLSAQKITFNPSLKVQCLVNIGDIYFANERYPQALKYYQDALLRRSDLEKAISSERISEIERRIDTIKNEGSL